MGKIIFHLVVLFALKYLFAVMTIIESNCRLSRPPPPPQSFDLSEGNISAKAETPKLQNCHRNKLEG